MDPLASNSPDTVVLFFFKQQTAYEMTGVASGLKRGGGPDLTMAGQFIGTSAGSIMATMITGGTPLERRMQRLSGDSDIAGAEVDPSYTRIGREPGRVRRSAAGLAAMAGLALLGPGSRFIRRAFLRRIPEGRHDLGRLGESIDRLGLSWNGRLRITAVDLESADRVVFGNEFTDSVSVSDAVLA